MSGPQAAEEKIFEKATWRILPIVAFMYFVSIVDKSNVGFAKLQMLGDLSMTEAAYGFGASLFFVGGLLFELPSSLYARRFGLRFWATRIMLTWGIATLCMMLVTTPVMFLVLRFILGLAEAGLYPAILFYLACWFPLRYRARATGFLTLGSAFGNGLGAALSGPMLDLDGTFGLEGWQWLFLVTGALPVITAVAIWRALPNSIDEAGFLSDEEKRIARAAVERDLPPPQADGKHFLAVLWDLRVLTLSLVFIVILTALYGVIYWLPTVVRGFGLSGTQTGLLSAVPWAFVALALLTIPRRLHHPLQIMRAVTAIALTGAVLFSLSMIVTANWAKFLCMALGTPCISLLIACFWTVPVRYFSGIHAAAALAVIVMWGNVGGFIAQNLMPWAASVTGKAVGAMYVPAAALGLICVGALVLLAWGARARTTALLVQPVGQAVG